MAGPDLPGVVLRPMIADDWGGVREVYRQGIATGDATFETVVPSWAEWDRTKVTHSRLVALSESSNDPDGVARAAASLGGVVGFAALSPVSSRCVYEGVLEVMVYVARIWRKRGVGGHLLRGLIESSERMGVWTLLAGVFPENIASIRLHERLGFRIIGTHERIGRMADGRWRDTVLLERRSSRVGVG